MIRDLRMGGINNQHSYYLGPLSLKSLSRWSYSDTHPKMGFSQLTKEPLDGIKDGDFAIGKS